MARDFNDVVVALDAAPYQSVVTDPNTGMAHPISITGRDIVAGVATLLVEPFADPAFPPLVSQLKADQYGTIDALASMLITPGLDASDGMALSVMCADRDRIDVQSGLRRLLAAHPEYEAVARGTIAAGPAWRVRPVPRSFNQPVVSAILTLVLAGEWDSSTPAKLARDAAAHLSRSSFVELPGLGHVVVRPTNPCAQSLFQAFFTNPGQPPDTTCVEQLPEPASNEESPPPPSGPYPEDEHRSRPTRPSPVARGQVRQ